MGSPLMDAQTSWPPSSVHLEIVARMGVQLFAMGAPLVFADEGVGQLPARKV